MDTDIPSPYDLDLPETAIVTGAQIEECMSVPPSPKHPPFSS